MNKKLLLLTESYPFSNKETFLENEIEYLSSNFSSIHIVASNGDSTSRETPSNVTYQSLSLWKTFTKMSKLDKAVLISRNLFKIPFKILLTKELYSKHWKFYLDELIIQLLKMIELKAVCFNSYNLIYDYWLTNSSLAVLLLKPKCPVIARAHHYDLYEKIYYPKSPPFTKFLFKELTCVFPISNHGSNYIKNNKIEYKTIIVSKLGVIDYYNQNTKVLKSNKKVIVSCSRIAPVKRVDLLANAIKQIKTAEIEWHHFGDGPLMEQIQKICSNHLNQSIFLHGNVSNSDIHKFYNTQHVDLFVSTSASEGIPVSMMEAICYGIPILSFNVGGVGEIVNEITGKFFNFEEPNVNHVKNEIENTLKIDFDREKIREFYLENFNAGKNYTNFIGQLNEFIQ